MSFTFGHCIVRSCVPLLILSAVGMSTVGIGIISAAEGSPDVVPVAVAEASMKAPVKDPELVALENKLLKLTAQNNVFAAELNAKLQASKVKSQELEATLALRSQELAAELSQIKEVKEKLELESSLRLVRQQIALEEERLVNEKDALALTKANNDIQRKELQHQAQQSDMNMRTMQLQLKELERNEGQAVLQQELRDIDM